MGGLRARTTLEGEALSRAKVSWIRPRVENVERDPPPQDAPGFFCARAGPRPFFRRRTPHGPSRQRQERQEIRGAAPQRHEQAKGCAHHQRGQEGKPQRRQAVARQEVIRTRAASRSTACATFAIASANASGGSSRARVGTSCSRHECCASAPSRGSRRRAWLLWTSETGEEGREVA